MIYFLIPATIVMIGYAIYTFRADEKKLDNWIKKGGKE